MALLDGGSQAGMAGRLEDKVAIITGGAGGQGAAGGRLFAAEGAAVCLTDVLVNNAGIFRPGRLLDTDFELWDTTIAVNQTGVFLDTPMLRQYDGIGLPAEMIARVPMGRDASGDEVARLALFPASDESAYCTGSEFVVDGGLTA